MDNPSAAAQKNTHEGKADLLELVERERRKSRLVQEIASALSSSLDLDELLALIMEKVRELMSADRATLFLVSEDGNELWSKILNGGESQEIRLKVGEGIAGWVALSGEIVNIADAYIDKRFQPAVDLRSGYRTKSILCVPMRDTTGEITGVVQLLNKEDGPFDSEDEELLSALAGQAAVSIENAKLYHSVVAKNVELMEAQNTLEARTNELNVLFEIEKGLSAASELSTILELLLHRAMGVVEARSGAIALVDDEGNGLRFLACVGPKAGHLLHRKQELRKGLLGWCCQRREPLVLSQPAVDARHVGVFSDSSGAPAEELLCTVLIDGDDVLGGIQLADKNRGQAFSQADLRMATLIAGQASRAIKVLRRVKKENEQERLAGIGQMVAGVLHDLKTPMTIISGYAQLMAQMDDAKERESYVEQILQQFDLLSGMTREVMAFARGESTVLIRKVYLHKYLDQVAEQLRNAFMGRNVRLEMDTRFDGAAFFDQQSMLRLIHNLARNAADAMRGKPGLFTISTYVDDEALCLDFSDNGPGIPEELNGRLFELFATASDGGTGLGLAICKKIVVDHGGSIDYESSPGEGTTFKVRLPRSPASK